MLRKLFSVLEGLKPTPPSEYEMLVEGKIASATIVDGNSGYDASVPNTPPRHFVNLLVTDPQRSDGHTREVKAFVGYHGYRLSTKITLLIHPKGNHLLLATAVLIRRDLSVTALRVH